MKSKTVCINLKERTDKFDFMSYQFEKYGIKDVEFYHPVIQGYSKHIKGNYTYPNEFGTMCSHYHVIKTALLEGCETLNVFEDDAAFKKEMSLVIPIGMEYDCLLYYSYMSALTPNNVRTFPRWTKGYASWSLLAYTMNRRTMKRYVEIADSKIMVADAITYQMMTNEGFNFWIATPPLVIPSKAFVSDIRGTNKNYDRQPFQGGNIFMLGINENDYESPIH